jgi:hypothetical protein
MQVRWGLSYKDAAHRLHMMEVQKLLAEKQAQLALTDTLHRLDRIIQDEISMPITDMT